MRIVRTFCLALSSAATLLALSACDNNDRNDSPPAAAPAVPTPPAPPPPTGTNDDQPWKNPALAPAERADALIAAMTLDQKIQQIANLPVENEDLQDENPPCKFQHVGRHIEGIPELGIPTFRFGNGGTGIRGGDCLPETTATALPSGVASAATFDPEINFRWGQVLGAELRAWAHHSLWGPAFNMIRTPYGGRNHEYMSEDPYLAGVTATQQVLGIQSNRKTHATIKHFVGNESEYQYERWTAASRIPSRAMHEIYLLPFEMVVRDAKPASVMCAFPHLNFAWACENHALLVETLRDRWGFDGYVVSDRRALHSTAASIHSMVSFELDFEPHWYAHDAITAALAAGDITEANIDALLRPRFLKMFEFGHFEEPYDAFLPKDLEADGAVSREAAAGSIVLLKNDGLLPLKPAVKSIALIGTKWFAGQATMPPRGGDPNEMTNVEAPFTVTPLQGLENTLKKLNSTASVSYTDGKSIAEAAKAAASADVAIVMVGDNPRETKDTTTASLPSIKGTKQDQLVPQILKANANTVVVLKTQGSVLMPWLAQAHALVEAWYPGEYDGDVVADVLFGVINPSGKLPVTFGNSAREAAYATQEQYPGVREDNGLGGGRRVSEPNGSPQLVTKYTENLQMGYRWYEAQKVMPVFPFGHGLSYTSFAYSDLTLTTSSPAPGQVALAVDYTITNTGSVAGKEASQIYLTLPADSAEPAQRLVGFKKVELQPGESQRVSVSINCAASNHPFSYFVPTDPADLRRWAEGDWATPSGRFLVHVGGSSANTPLDMPIDLDLASCTQ